MAKAYTGVRFIGIDERDNLESARAFNRTQHLSYPSLVDPSGSIAREFNEVESTPTTVILDRAGRIAAVALGALDYSDLKALVDDVRFNHSY
jgi:peroxiredoxin